MEPKTPVVHTSLSNILSTVLSRLRTYDLFEQNKFHDGKVSTDVVNFNCGNGARLTINVHRFPFNSTKYFQIWVKLFVDADSTNVKISANVLNQRKPNSAHNHFLSVYSECPDRSFNIF